MLHFIFRILFVAFGLGLLSAASAQTPGSIVPGANYGPIPDGAAAGPLAYGEPRDIFFNVSNRTGSIDVVRVFFRANHSFVGDLKVQLIAPDGRSHLLFERTGATSGTSAGFGSNLIDSVQYFFGDDFSGVTGTNWWTAADVAGDIGQVNLFATVVSGGPGVNIPAPVTSMTETFRSTEPNGTWILRFEDGWQGDSGEVTEAELVIEATGVDRPVSMLNDAGPGSLREAITLAQPGDAIRLPSGTPGQLEFINLQSALPPLPDGVGIFGPGSVQLLIQGASQKSFRIFDVPDDHHVTVSGLWLNNGRAAQETGGGLRNRGILTLVDTRFTNHSARNGGAIAGDNGRLTILRSTVSENVAEFGVAGILLRGNSRTLISDTVINGQLAGSRAQEAVTVLAQGGSETTLTLQNSTLTNLNGESNELGLTVTTQGAGSRAHVTIANTLLQSATNLRLLTFGGAEPPVVVSRGFNLASDEASNVLTQVGDQINTDARLQPANIFSDGSSYFLGNGSPAIDSGRARGPAILELRGSGFERTVDLDDADYPNPNGSDASDIGAVEMQTPPLGDTLFRDRFAEE